MYHSYRYAECWRGLLVVCIDVKLMFGIKGIVCSTMYARWVEGEWRRNTGLDVVQVLMYRGEFCSLH